MTPRKYKIHFTKCYQIKKKISLLEVRCFFEKIKNTYFDLLPLEILEKIYFYNHGIGKRLEIPKNEYIDLLKKSIDTSKLKVKKWLLNHSNNVVNVDRKFINTKELQHEICFLLRYFYKARKYKIVKELARFFDIEICHFNKNGVGYFLD
jgi:hypothetical protein